MPNFVMSHIAIANSADCHMPIKSGGTQRSVKTPAARLVRLTNTEVELKSTNDSRRLIESMYPRRKGLTQGFHQALAHHQQESGRSDHVLPDSAWHRAGNPSRGNHAIRLQTRIL